MSGSKCREQLTVNHTVAARTTVLIPSDAVDRSSVGSKSTSTTASRTADPIRIPDSRGPTGDSFVAYAVGPQAWGAGSSEWSVAKTSAAAVGLLGLSGMAVATVMMMIWNPLHRVAHVRAELVCLALLGLLAVAKPLLGILAEREDRFPISAALTLRCLGFGLFLTSWVALTPLSAVILLFPIGLFAGADIGLTSHLVGFDRATIKTSMGYVVSPIHLGAVTAVAAVVVLARSTRTTTTAIGVLLGVEITALIGVISAAAVRQLFRREDAVAAHICDEQRSVEHHRRAHWIHDDVCADIRGLRVKVAAHTLTGSEIESELEELDHRLRLRQLDEVVAGGSATAAEVLQPYLRKLQHQGIQLTTVPHFDESAYTVLGQTAELLQRCAAGLTSNAVAAGATAVGLSLHATVDFLTLTVTDDAGGFKLEESPAGRGLYRLANDLLPGTISVEPTGTGSAVIARIPLERGRS